MHECILCKRDMKKSKHQFGSGCINNVFKFLNITKPSRIKNKEQLLYKNIMKKTNISNINKEQKIWLTDRYLTYQYLDKLQYGNFDKLKQQINIDIENVTSISNFEELSTVRKIKLKEAYDLYKKEKKFDTNIDKIKENKYKDDEELKLLITSMSFIFNMYKNKTQYEKNSFKAMQYTFWQTVIEVGREYAGFDISADFLQHSLKETPENLLITDGKVIEEIKNDNQFQENINNIVKKYGKNKNKFIFDSQVNTDYPMHFNNSDLYFAIHSASLKIIGNFKDEKWTLHIKLHDRYDYSDFKEINQYYNDTNSIPKSIFSSTLYNLAYYSIKFKVMKEYDIDIQFELNGFEVME